MQFKPFEPGIEVPGEALQAFLDSFKKYPTVVMKYLVKFGLAKSAGGHPPTIDRSCWYPQENWLSACEQIAREVGPRSIFALGKSVPERVSFPANMTDIYSAVRSIDIAYHMNHRKNGLPMFNPETGAMLDGIGHYFAKLIADERKMVCVCETPYPCEFDHGVIVAIVARLKPLAKTVHDDAGDCRKKGGGSCTFVVTW